MPRSSSPPCAGAGPSGRCKRGRDRWRRQRASISYKVTSVTPAVRARRSAASDAVKPSGSKSSVAPPAPANLKVQRIGSSRVGLTWTVSPGASFLRVWRNDAAAQTGVGGNYPRRPRFARPTPSRQSPSPTLHPPTGADSQHAVEAVNPRRSAPYRTRSRRGRPPGPAFRRAPIAQRALEQDHGKGQGDSP